MAQPERGKHHSDQLPSGKTDTEASIKMQEMMGETRYTGSHWQNEC